MTATKSEQRWKERHYGRCKLCPRHGLLLRHHVFYQQHVRREDGHEWDLRNSLDVGAYCTCHSNHHARVKVIPLTALPDSALEFGAELMGPARAAAYLRRRYSGTDPRLDRLEEAA